MLYCYTRVDTHAYNCISGLGLQETEVWEYFKPEFQQCSQP